MKKVQEPATDGSWTKNGLAFIPLYFHLSGAVTGVTGKNKSFIIIFATKSLMITCDNCDTLKWMVVVPILNDYVTREPSGTCIMVSNPL